MADTIALGSEGILPSHDEDGPYDYRDVLADSGPFVRAEASEEVKGLMNELIHLHDQFKYKRNVFQKLAEFDDLSQCKISSGEAETILQDEMIRLLGAESNDEPLRLHLSGSSSDSSIPTGPSRETVSRVCRLIQSCLHICSYDTAITTLKELKDYRAHGGKIAALLAEASLIAEESSLNLLNHYCGTRFTEAQLPEALRRTEEAAEISHIATELLDYISAQCIRLFNRSVRGGQWISMCTAIMTRMIAKLKIILQDPATYARQAIDRGNELRTSAEIGAIDTYRRQINVDNSFRTSYRQRAFLVNDVTPIVRYYNTMFKMRLHITRIFDTILEGITGEESEAGTEFEASYELTNIVCENADQPLWSVCSDRREVIMVTSEEVMLRVCYAGWSIARHDLRIIAENASTTTSQPSRSSLDIGDASELVMVHVLAAISSLFVANNVQRMLIHMARYAEQGHHPTAWDCGRFDMKLSLIVGTPIRPSDDKSDWAPLSDFRLPRKYFQNGFPDQWPGWKDKRVGVLRKIHASFRSRQRKSNMNDIEMGIMHQSQSLPKDDDEVAKLVKQYKHWNKVEMSRWILNSNSITVPCPRYVLSLITIWFLTVIGGIAFLCVMRTDTLGFDPANVLVLMWALASLLVILGKSRYVGEWTWNDFLHYQVPCRSVSEASRASGVPEQVVLLFLYRKLSGWRSREKMKVVGRNGLFPPARRGASDGFSIDRSFKRTTLLSCGLVVLKVSGYNGDRVICVGGRKRTESAGWAALISGDWITNRLVCQLPDKSDLKRFKAENKDFELLFREEECFLERCQGLYIEDRATFG
ncbi:hypothetical protein PG991_003482 [Apiospora marii]|uniref:SPX domain-containing protein n=1 Tax=Apiospora marii TaxID=335849 RepID=A0ABR1S3P7_9PEZI